MWRAYSLVLRKYITADECNYLDVPRLQIKCPYCYEPVMLRMGEYVSSYFAHYSNTKNYSITGLNKGDCPNRVESNGYGGYSIENFFSYHGQELLVQFAHFSKFFDEFIHYQKPRIDIVTELSAFRENIRHKSERGNEYAKELLYPQMKDFFDITLAHFIQKVLLSNQKELFAYDSVVDKIVFSYLKVLEGLSESYRNRKFNFSEEGRKYEEYYNLNFSDVPKIVIVKDSGKTRNRLSVVSNKKNTSRKSRNYKRYPFSTFCSFIKSLDNTRLRQFLTLLYDEVKAKNNLENFLNEYRESLRRHRIDRSDYRVNRAYIFYCKNRDEFRNFPKNKKLLI